MAQLSQATVLGFALLLAVPPLHAQQAPSAPPPSGQAAAPDVAPAQAPDEMTRKISELVHAGKYAEAQQLTSGLLIAYPGDQRLVKAKALIDSLISDTASGTAAGGSAPAVPTPEATARRLAGADQLDYEALIELAHQAQQTTDLAEQTRLLQQFMEMSAAFLQKHPEQLLLWQVRAASAVSLNLPMAGYDAAQHLLAAGAMESSDPNLHQLLAKLKLLGWLDRSKAESLQLAVDKESQQRAAAAEAERKQAELVKYTFPVMHERFPCCGYGRLTLDEDAAHYKGNDGALLFSRSDIREVRIECRARRGCGVTFYTQRGGGIGFTAVTAQSVDDMNSRNVVYPPSVLWDAIVARWKFVPDGKVLKPPAP
jgi:hypothetical protein